MPGPRTYQAIGFATYHGGKLYGRRKRAEAARAAELQRRGDQQRHAALAGAAAVALIGVLAAGAAVRRRSRLPSF